jgi:hypothetical protein
MMQDTCRPETPTLSDALPLTIVGFGACMIAGYPHEDGGFFEVACGRVEESLSRPIQSHTISLDGFPAPRAAKYFKQRVVKFNPDYVVIQFGATDAQCPIRAKNRLAGYKSKRSAQRSIYYAPTDFTVARWEIASLIAFLRKARPITPLFSYVEAISRMVEDCGSLGATPVVLSPFVFGSRYSSRNAILYANALHELQSRARDMIFIDCIELLSILPKKMILLNDGFHISNAAHNLIGKAIGKAIIADAVGRARQEPAAVQRCRSEQEHLSAGA